MRSCGAVAASGQASELELADLRSHLETCPSCRSVAYDFTEISAQGLSVLAAERERRQIPSGMTQRFVARLGSEGIEMRRDASTIPKRNRFAVFAAIGAVAAAALIVSFLTFGRPKPSISAGGHIPANQAPVAVSGTNSQPAQVPDAYLLEQLASARAEMNALDAKIKAQVGELASASKAEDTLNSHVADVERENAALLSDRPSMNLESSSSRQNWKVRVGKERKRRCFSSTRNRASRASKKVADQTEALGQQQEFAAKAGDVRELVTARNLHIIDVHDRDGDGKNQRAFWPYFLHRGEVPHFLCVRPRRSAESGCKVSFYVWGEHLGAEKPVRSLGIFHNDDVSDGRWVLTFDDPHVLAQINSVFVTVESSRKTNKRTWRTEDTVCVPRRQT